MSDQLWEMQDEPVRCEACKEHVTDEDELKRCEVCNKRLCADCDTKIEPSFPVCAECAICPCGAVATVSCSECGTFRCATHSWKFNNEHRCQACHPRYKFGVRVQVTCKECGVVTGDTFTKDAARYKSDVQCHVCSARDYSHALLGNWGRIGAHNGRLTVRQEDGAPAMYLDRTKGAA